MSVCFTLLFSLVCFAVPALAQPEVPAEIIDAVRKAGGPYAAELLRELLLVIGAPGAWLLKNEWILTMLLGLLGWAVVGRIALPPLKIWVTEGTGKRFIDAVHGTFSRLNTWINATLEGPVVEMMCKKRGWRVLVVLFAASLVFDKWGKLSDDDSFGAIVISIAGLGALAWVLWGVGNDAYKTITSMNQPGVSVEYPYSLRTTFLGVVFGAVGLAGMAIAEMFEGSGQALLKDMEVLAGGAIMVVAMMIGFPCFFLLFCSALLLAGPILHVLAVFLMWPVVMVFKKGIAEVAPGSESESR